MSVRCRRRGRIKAPNLRAVASDCHGVINTIAEISIIDDDIDHRRDKLEAHIPIATLDRVSDLSALLSEEIPPLSLSAISSLQELLTVYKLILVDIHHMPIPGEPMEISDDTINRRLDDFALQLQEAMDNLNGTVNQRSSAHSTNFFQDSHHFVITGGTFSSHPVAHDPVVREQSHKMLQMAYIQCGVLFA